jgi:hypothetical protein
MDNLGTTYRTDWDLTAMLFETANWSVQGQQGNVLCMAASLQRAIERTDALSSSGAIVTGLTTSGGDIIVPPDQIRRLKHRAAVL